MIYILLAIMFVILFVLKSPTIKGKIGEKSVVNKLGRLDNDKYIILNDVTIPKASGGTTQIDHIVVSIYGIFVIETKNYRGWITGNEHDEYWRQTIYKRKERLYNPIRQNFGHVKALEALLDDYADLKFIPIVSFSSRADLKVKVTSEVIYSTQLLKTIRQNQNIVMGIEDVKRIVGKISSANLTNRSTKREHVRDIKKAETVKKNKISNGECPKCGNHLVDRNGKYGKFKGCSNYPKCRFIAN
ncbi:NERD domain-containing protein [Paenibacillus glycanilyticus]|uniref:DNA-binding protein n=1 Tax=Paenibacillus glycanilyticus TaxID=126569 RepID=A0ABQ6GMC7_9BACL|nr:NERD domain-containing protein [Paenibacillus glycanilyticus]GLX71405.1 DNA-binding protein [Paenibacillus glycanilyticus]